MPIFSIASAAASLTQAYSSYKASIKPGIASWALWSRSPNARAAPKRTSAYLCLNSDRKSERLFFILGRLVLTGPLQPVPVIYQSNLLQMEPRISLLKQAGHLLPPGHGCL